ncbi:hypothetical protein Psi01_68940 [Planobispora siamensis]|uniref:Uncharacterized protein n=1 Tax=Planobispora siamensis TaxID=936338 RepID=A0A8J3SPY2_9ACTN|nr:hypothetical protein Psi01_68940 [Planobispora siamensis]
MSPRCLPGRGSGFTLVSTGAPGTGLKDRPDRGQSPRSGTARVPAPAAMPVARLGGGVGWVIVAIHGLSDLVYVDLLLQGR